MKKFFFWLIFFHKYYLNELKEYTKPLKTNAIKHNDISALIDPYIQAYISHFKSLNNKMTKSEYYEMHKKYILPKLVNIIIFDKNKDILPVFLDVQAYFTSKIRQINDNINTLNKIKDTLINLDIKAPEFKNKATMDLIKIYSIVAQKNLNKFIETIKDDVNNIDSIEKLNSVANEYYNNSIGILNNQIKIWSEIINKETITKEFNDSLKSLSIL